MRLFEKKICNDCKLFQSTHSLRSATRGRKNSFLPCWFQSTHSLRSATGCKRKRFSLSSFQSTHSLRSATRNFSAYCGDEAVSIHALLAECDLHTFPSAFAVRGFNPRTPCGVRPNPRSRYSWYSSVSIHALLAECDRPGNHGDRGIRGFNPRTPCGVRPASLALTTQTRQFQSTHSLRSATIYPSGDVETIKVSIHALLAECDLANHFKFMHPAGFNPRTPCGVRRNRLYTLLLNRANHTLRQPP